MPVTPDHLWRVREFLLAPENFESVRDSSDPAARGAAVDEFLSQADADTPAPVRWFDAQFYLDFRGDRAASHPNPYVDFVLSGRFKGYYPSAAALERDAERLATAHPAGATQYEREVPGLSSPTDHARHFIRHGFHDGLVWIPGFDRSFVEKHYPEYVDTTVNSCVYAALFVKQPWFFLNLEQASHQIRLLWGSDYFDEPFYRAQLPELEGNARLHYLTQGVRARLDPSPEFSTSFYLEKYADIAAVEMNPLIHYTIAGRTEGRKISADIALERRVGQRTWDPSKPSILVASHEGSRTGAPIVGLRLAAGLAERYNVVVWLGRGGDLVEEFLSHCTTLLIGFPARAELGVVVRNLLRQVPLEFAVLNSVETYPLLVALTDERVGIVSLIHEFADYTRPRGRLSRMVSYSQYAVMPAMIIRESCEREFDKHLLPPPRNIVIRPQGTEDHATRAQVTAEEADELRRSIVGDKASKIVFGAGWVQPRKGVDWFVDIARRIVHDYGDDAKFVWVGGGYNPDNDMHYGIWLREQIRRSGVEEHVVMLPEQPHLEAFWAITDVFLLPSLLDPFPNVALDAITHGKPVVCFQGATGIAELADEPAFGVTSVRYGDTFQAAKAVSNLLREPEHRRPSRSSDVVTNLLSFDSYVRDVERLGLKAKRTVDQFRVDIREHVGARLFDARFFETGFPPWLRHAEGEAARAETSALRYQRLASAGVYAAKPRPGFNDALVSKPNLADDSPYLGVFAAKPPTGSHDVVFLHADDQHLGSKPALSSLVHLHLYHTGTASDFAERLTQSGLESDLLITTDTEEKRLELETVFREWSGGRVTVQALGNRGRNIGPLLHVLATSAEGYELICHVHSKATSALSKASVDTWSTFVLDHLLGSAGYTRQVIRAFEQDLELGLLFADDPTVVGWTKNRPFADEVAGRLSWERPLPSHPEFPVGCMFWARTAALESLVRSGLTVDDLPAEPVPYDGSTLHAIERLIPAACVESGYRWKTLHRKGLRRYA